MYLGNVKQILSMQALCDFVYKLKSHFFYIFQPLSESDIWYLCVVFQHPFIANACDSRAVLQLLSEAKAEVVEEIEDIDESSVSQPLVQICRCH